MKLQKLSTILMLSCVFTLLFASCNGDSSTWKNASLNFKSDGTSADNEGTILMSFHNSKEQISDGKLVKEELYRSRLKTASFRMTFDNGEISEGDKISLSFKSEFIDDYNFNSRLLKGTDNVLYIYIDNSDPAYARFIDSYLNKLIAYDAANIHMSASIAEGTKALGTINLKYSFDSAFEVEMKD